MVELIRNAGYQRIVVETVGVGQSEVEIAGLADVTVVVTVPESGDDVQTLKSGVMEIADLFAVNKCDRDGAAKFAAHLRELSQYRSADKQDIEVIQTTATTGAGIQDLVLAIDAKCKQNDSPKYKIKLLADKVLKLVSHQRMGQLKVQEIEADLLTAANNPDFNLYLYARQYFIPF